MSSSSVAEAMAGENAHDTMMLRLKEEMELQLQKNELQLQSGEREISSGKGKEYELKDGKEYERKEKAYERKEREYELKVKELAKLKSLKATEDKLLRLGRAGSGRRIANEQQALQSP
jgi:hypothetical protein